MLLKDIPPFLVTYCLDKRLSETKQGASDYLTQQVERFLHLFTEEGYSRKKDLTCAEAMGALPAILALSPFSINIDGLLKHTLRSPISNQMNLNDISFRKVHDYLALYADRIIKYFSNQPEIISKVFHLIHQSTEIVLPLVSSLSPEQIPNKSLQQKIKKWLAFGEKEITLDEIVTHRYLHPYCGDCGMMETTHDNTLLNKDSKRHCDYGNAVLISVNDILIGSLKFSGERSMVGLRTIKDQEGRYPLVLGGVYALSKEVGYAAEIVQREAGSYFSKLHLEKLAVSPLRFLGSYDKDGFSSNREFARKLKKKRKQLEIVDNARNNRIK